MYRSSLCLPLLALLLGVAAAQEPKGEAKKQEGKAPPRQVRAVLWQYWFTTPEEKRANGIWWRREQLGLYAPTLEREADGRIVVQEWPTMVEPRE